MSYGRFAAWILFVWGVAACDSGALGGTSSADGGSCLVPRVLCGDTCSNLDTDPAHCGSCDNACGTGEFCSAGTCGRVCPSGTRTCGASCVDLATDRANCGACGTACGEGEACTNGGCRCPSGTTRCGGECVSTDSDGENCGLCGRACDVDRICSSGTCVCATGSRETSCTDGEDDDCDGMVDCADPDCNGATRSCRDSVCGAGVQTCNGAGSWGTCSGGGGRSEICGDGIDQDCDGRDTRLPDEWETNDTCDQAKMIGSTDPNMSIYATFDSVSDNYDYFKISVTDSWVPGEILYLSLTGIPTGHDYDLYLYKGLTNCRAGSALAYSNETSNESEYIFWTEPAGGDDGGTYYIRVVRYRGQSCTMPYELFVNGLR